MKHATRYLVTHPLFLPLAFPLTRRVAPIFMMHRFRDRDAGNYGHEPAILRANLEWLRAKKFSILPLADLLDRISEGAPIEKTVAFTVDDGYADFGNIAAPIFAEFDCPVTVFVTTGFLDGQVWMWWDRVSLALNRLGRQAEIWSKVDELKRVPEAVKLERIDQLTRESGLDLPHTPPPAYAPLKWDDVRRLARAGVSFGPHTVTHPVLSRAGDTQVTHEITESWARLRSELDEALPIFCYPNGEPADFGARERDVVASLNMRAALSTRPGYVTRHDFDASHPAARYQLPRLSYTENRAHFLQVAGGIERAKAAVRELFGSRNSKE